MFNCVYFYENLKNGGSGDWFKLQEIRFLERSGRILSREEQPSGAGIPAIAWGFFLSANACISLETLIYDGIWKKICSPY